MKIGMVGMGRMGGNMAARIREAGHEVVGYDAHSEASQVGSLAECVDRCDAPRVVWAMVPAGDPTEQVITELAGLLYPGDVVVDGGNANWHDSVRRAGELAERGIGFVDAGTSGGVWGRTEGYCLMVGGDDEHVAVVQPIFDALTPADGGFVHAGPVGTGHFTKMVHNGIEYGMMQAYAEGYELLARSDLGIDVEGALDAWRHGSVVRSWLLDLMVRALQQTPDLDGIAGVAQDSGEGRWTVQEAVERGVATPVISAALFARFVSQQPESIAMRAIAALRHQFGGHAVLPETDRAEGEQPVRPPAGDGAAAAGTEGGRPR
ncbi:MAG TPA: decarboxylating 6-phosphogluconate dehydrogenase [Acidimicrobiales bacterium]|nr:decarboxylating 6-phosphogluconate dehydrogenase [Acidimicrobiales bacterium]HEU0171504.1 decarboxylating 6-phosphogluconate dehydrogenase [Acidimicrobiales bacterium]